MQNKFRQDEISTSSPNKNLNLIKEAANSIGLGIISQESGDYKTSKPLMKEGIEKIKHILLRENTQNNKLVLEYYSIFDKFLQSVNNDEEFDKNEVKLDTQTEVKNFLNDSVKDTYFTFIQKKNYEESEFIFLPLKIVQKLGESIQQGTYFSKNFYIRKEIWQQSNARIECLHQKYEAYKAIFEKIDNLKILSDKNVIKIENIDKFCDMLIDIQNNFAKEYAFIKPCVFNTVNDLGQAGFYRKFSEISNKIKGNLLSNKLYTKTDYIENILKMINKTNDIEIIFNNNNLRNLNPDLLRERKIQISMFFYNTIFKLLMQDVRELTLRFLKKKYLTFENRNNL